MFSAISSYLFGEEDDTEKNYEDLSEVEENDWIFVENVPIQGETSSSPHATNNTENVHKKPGMEESWFVTPPSCFSGDSRKNAKDESSTSTLENLLIEHPSMSVYCPRTAAKGACPEKAVDSSNVVAKQNGATRRVAQGKIFLCQSQNQRVALKDLGCNYGNSMAYSYTRKGGKRSDSTHQRALHGRHFKKLNRKEGKHTGMVGKRAA